MFFFLFASIGEENTTRNQAYGDMYGHRGTMAFPRTPQMSNHSQVTGTPQGHLALGH